MREILFRGKLTDDSKWVYGCLLDKIYGAVPAIMSEQSVDDAFNLEFEYDHVQEKTIGQFTGLTDKNGKRIFEGDIVVCKQEICGNWIDYCMEFGFVEMKHGAFGLHRKQGYYRPFKDWLEDYEYEVLGNIHDNPELLGGDWE